MSSLPKITESDIRKRGNAGTWSRALRYHQDDAVRRVVWQAPRLTAEVYGSQPEPYEVSVTFDGNQIVSTRCTCPYNRGGDCKHILAALLQVVHQPKSIEVIPPMESLLENLDAEALRALVLELTAIYPHLGEEVVRFIRRKGIVSAAQRPATSKEVAQEAEILGRQIRAETRAEFQMPDERYYYDDFGVNAESILQPAVSRAEAYIQAGEPRNALILLEIATRSWMEASERAPDYLVEWVEDYIDEQLLPLASAWSKALLIATLTDEEKDYWRATLSAFEKEALGGEALEMPLAALEQGWDYPPLVRAMQGESTPRGAWGTDDVPSFADDLTALRLEILAERGDYQAYLNLAFAEGAHLRYVTMLIQLGRYEEAVRQAIALLRKPGEIQKAAEALAAAGEMEKALRVGAHGLELEPGPFGRPAGLAVWVRDAAIQHGDRSLALRAARLALQYRTTLENYLAWQKAAGEDWPRYRAEALKITTQSNTTEGKIRIYLHEGMDKEVMRAVKASTWLSDELLEEIVTALKEKHPRWCFQQYRKRAEDIMDAGRSAEYETAVAWLRRGREVLLAAGETAFWNKYLDATLEKHWRKYKLRPMLEALRNDTNAPPPPRRI